MEYWKEAGNMERKWRECVSLWVEVKGKEKEKETQTTNNYPRLIRLSFNMLNGRKHENRFVCVLCVCVCMWLDLLLALWVNKQWIKLSKNQLVRMRSGTRNGCRHLYVYICVFVYVYQISSNSSSHYVRVKERTYNVVRKKREFVTIYLSVWMKK